MIKVCEPFTVLSVSMELLAYNIISTLLAINTTLLHARYMYININVHVQLGTCS